ncbi:GntG family PLP-dependent aldolase [Kallotenue papyrolyticum]|uniref:GntG family PLP-dependent aldolase n=1 Tax=Kallotenue papyrolyticum TaxID=1325125 RepID=UPI000492D5FA|nr:GntG family PLP-dependent aldolase [Kallotenue papyrolyticum]
MPIDLRSDTVTLPSPEMRRAMAEAELGDDVYGEDPTVNRLQELAAELLGKEAALLVASGTMGNLVALLAHAPRGAKVILGDESHIFNYEQGGAAVVGGLVYHTLPTGRFGELPLERLASAAQRVDDAHYAQPGVICLENTHNRCGGTIIPLDYVAQVRAIADREGLPLHLDGARLPNAAVALGCSLRELAAPFDSVQLDLSKGLAAPVGGVVAGSRAFIARAHRARKLLGGGMRQAGVIAAAGIVALERMVDRLAEDHAHARRLAEELAAFPDVRIDLETVQTNLVVFRLDPARWTPQRFIAAMREQGVLLGGFGDDRLRFATHYGITRADIDATLLALRRVLGAA